MIKFAKKKRGIGLEKSLEFDAQEAQRLDTFLADKLSQTRSQTAQLIKKGAVSIDGKQTHKPGLKLKGTQKVAVELPEARQSEPMDVDFDVEVLFEDEDILVLNKPSGVTVHSAPSVKEATLVDWLKKRGVRLSTISGEERHGIVHRLDKGTSGVMVVAKTNEAHSALASQLEDKSMGRYYLAVLTPPLKEELSVVERPIARNPSNRIKMACVEGGKEAKTAFLQLTYSNDEKEQLVACKLFSGRTHQIRVHLESISRHIVGDTVYAANIGKASAEHILLHAYILYLRHPITGKAMQFVAPYDEVFESYLRKKFEMEKVNETTQPEYIVRKFDTASF